MARSRFLFVVMLVLTAGAPAAAQAGCGWTAGLAPLDGVDGPVLAQAVWDDGGGPALFVGGAFGIAGGVVANRIARWDGASWSALGAGMNGEVRTLTVHDDGAGPALFAGGAFTIAGGAPAANIARWNGSSWAALGAGLDGAVNALASFAAVGSGGALFAGGVFSTAGGVPAPGIAAWSGANWSDVAGSVTAGPSDVRAFAIHDDGSGLALYAGGAVQAIGGTAPATIARWNGVAWSGVGAGIPAATTAANVQALAVFDDGAGPALVAGGTFGLLPPAVTSPVAFWNGAVWAPLGTMVGQVTSLAVFDSGSGPRLHAGGSLTALPGGTDLLFRWSGAAWTAVPSATHPPSARTLRSLQVFGSGPVARLIAGGNFTATASGPARNLAAHDGAAWERLGGRLPFDVRSIAIFDGGAGPELWIAGRLPLQLGSAGRLVSWNGQTWTDRGAGLDSGIECLLVRNEAAGPALYAGGTFTQIGGIAARGAARWDGVAWSALGSGFQNGIYAGAVLALAVFDDGTGPALHAGGTFASAGGVPAASVARWNGNGWGPVGAGLWSPGLYAQSVKALAVHDDGTGSALYATGEFWYSGTASNPVPAGNVARWNGSTWSKAGAAVLPAVLDGTALAVHDDGAGGGAALFLGARYMLAGAPDVAGILRWNGSQWIPAGGPMTGFAPSTPAFALASLDDGGGRALYAGLSFADAGAGPPLNGVGRWDGSSWNVVGGGVSGSGEPFAVSALAVFDAGNGPALHAGGRFTTAGGVPSANFAQWQCATPGLIIDQPGGPGAPVVITNVRLSPGVETYNVFSAWPCPGPPGGGPYLGLCAPDPALLLAQVLAPAGAAPFHFIAPAAVAGFGPYAVGPMAVDGVCFEVAGGALGRVSPAVRAFVR